MFNTIVLKGRGIRKEGLAGAAGILPGHLVTRNAANAVIVHGVAAGNAQAAFAVENELIGDEISTAYANGDTTHYEVCPPGAEINAILAANAAAIIIGSYLESAGDGTLRITTAAAATANTARAGIIAKAIEAVDNSAGGTIARIKVELL